MTRNGATAISPRVGEVRLSDVAPHVGDVRQFTVRVLDRAGVEHLLQLHFTEKWAGSWQRQLQCPRCSGPARVLRVAHATAACQRCLPLATAHHMHKNSRSWKVEGALADELARALLRESSSSTTSSKTKRLATRLKRITVLRAARVLEVAESVIRAIDNAGVLER